MKKQASQKILYITPPCTPKTALSVRINITHRIMLMRRLGHTIVQIPYKSVWSISDWYSLYQHAQNADIVMIRIDGSTIGDLYTLIKLIRSHLRIIWEVHGFPEENAPTTRVIMRHIIKKYIRTTLSFLVDTCIYISDELMLYSKLRLFAKHHTVIPNFISEQSPHFSLRATELPARICKKVKNKFVVLWGGSPQFSWQAMDLIEKLSTYIAQIDPMVLFVIVGKDSWFPLEPTKNIIRIPIMNRYYYRALLRRADVCLALYHKPPQIPFYFFPMKIVDYMYYKCPVIASSFPVLSSIISHGINGLLVSDDVQNIAYNIFKLKNNSKLRYAIGQAAHKTIRYRYATPIIKRMYTDLLN